MVACRAMLSLSRSFPAFRNRCSLGCSLSLEPCSYRLAWPSGQQAALCLGTHPQAVVEVGRKCSSWLQAASRSGGGPTCGVTSNGSPFSLPSSLSWHGYARGLPPFPFAVQQHEGWGWCTTCGGWLDEMPFHMCLFPLLPSLHFFVQVTYLFLTKDE